MARPGSLIFTPFVAVCLAPMVLNFGSTVDAQVIKRIQTGGDAAPSFEVATIKPSRPGTELAILIVGGHNFKTTASTLADLLMFAYSIHANQIIAAPAWVKSQTFDVEAQPDMEGEPNAEQMRSMVRKLLANRFQLAFHREVKELPVYKIAIAKSGPKLPYPSSEPMGKASVGFQGRRGAMRVKNTTISEFAGFLQRYVLDRPVINETRISGKYDFGLDWKPDDTTPEGRISQNLPLTSESVNLPDLYTAIQEQLGLKLKAAKAPVEVLVVDRVDQPSPN